MGDTTVRMRCDVLGVVVDGPFAEAETLLRMRNNGGWTLDDEGYEYNTEKRRLVRAGRPAGVRRKK